TKNTSKFKNDILNLYGKKQPKLVKYLTEAAEGNNIKLNKWLFAIKSNYKGIVPWLSKVKTEQGEKFVWLLSNIDNEGQMGVRAIINKAWPKIIKDKLYSTECKRPPYAVFLQNVVSSQWQNQQPIHHTENAPIFGRLGMFVETNALPHNKPLTPANNTDVNLSSDIEIFQNVISETGFTEDIDQKMPLSSDLFIARTEKILTIIKLCCTPETIKFYEQNVMPNKNIITKLHAEFHNHGHFLGPQSYTNKDKFEDSYEAIEEFRSCLIAGALTEHLDVEIEIILGLPLHIFFMRYIGYGFESLKKSEKDLASFREMEVGALFFNLLEREHGLEIINNKLHLNINKLPAIFKNEVQKIHDLETQYKSQGKTGLVEIAKYYRNYLQKDGAYTPQTCFHFLTTKF
ncbi:MAG: hypothetical protein ORN85_08170, partial [Sediminibacterium sp.]|nr:hypothetical protein [Sediminibacterium sp.]